MKPSELMEGQVTAQVTRGRSIVFFTYDYGKLTMVIASGPDDNPEQMLCVDYTNRPEEADRVFALLQEQMLCWLQERRINIDGMRL